MQWVGSAKKEPGSKAPALERWLKQVFREQVLQRGGMKASTGKKEEKKKKKRTETETWISFIYDFFQFMLKKINTFIEG